MQFQSTAPHCKPKESWLDIGQLLKVCSFWVSLAADKPVKACLDSICIFGVFSCQINLASKNLAIM